MRVRILLLGLLAGLLMRPASAADDPLGRALELRQAGDRAGARQVLETWLSAHPRDSRATYLKGILLLEQGQPREAVESLALAVDLEPGLRQARLSLAAAVQALVYESVDRGSFEPALEVLRAHAPRIADEPTVLFLEGAVHLERWRRTGDREAHNRALECWSRSRDQRPVSAVGELLAGLAAFESRDYERAREHFRFALAIRDRNRYAALWHGLAEAALGRYDAALEELEACRATFGRNPSLHRYLGDVRFCRALVATDPQAAERDLEEAEAAYRRSLDLQPDDGRVQGALGDLLHHRGRLEDAVRRYQEARRLRPGRPEESMRLGALLQDLGRTAEAEHAFRSALASAEGLPGGEGQRLAARAALEAALCLLENGGSPAAAEALARPRLAWLPPEARHRRLLYEGLAGRTEERAMALTEALAWEGPGTGPTQCQAWTALGDLERGRGARVAALRCYAEAWRLAPPQSPRARALARRFEETRREELADIAAWEANNTLVFLADVVTGGGRGGRIEERKQALETLQLGPGGDRYRPGTPAPPTPWPAELEGELAGQAKAAVQGPAVPAVRKGWEEP